MANTEVNGKATIKPARTGFFTDSQEEKLIKAAAINIFSTESMKHPSKTHF